MFSITKPLHMYCLKLSKNRKKIKIILATDGKVYKYTTYDNDNDVKTNK